MSVAPKMLATTKGELVGPGRIEIEVCEAPVENAHLVLTIDVLGDGEDYSRGSVQLQHLCFGADAPVARLGPLLQCKELGAPGIESQLGLRGGKLVLCVATQSDGPLQLRVRLSRCDLSRDDSRRAARDLSKARKWLRGGTCDV